MSQRELDLRHWLATLMPNADKNLQALAGDASFRRYYRWFDAKESYIVMDAPPPKESIEPFLSITTFLSEHGIRSPGVFGSESKQGFLLLEDFGDNLFLAWLQNASHKTHPYAQAMHIILQMQSIPQSVVEAIRIPAYSKEKLQEEIAQFPEWMLEKYLQYPLDAKTKGTLAKDLSWVVQTVALQPSSFVHRDYHSRNLMLIQNGELGVLDYQDAVWGPYTYDLVSLLKDCYIRWPDDDIERWALDFYAASPIATRHDKDKFLYDFHLMGLQRHLKVLGVFCRLSIRDNKHGYLADLPRVLEYAISAAKRFPELRYLQQILGEIRLP